MDPEVIMETPLLMLVNILFRMVYLKVGYLTYKAKQQILNRQIYVKVDSDNRNSDSVRNSSQNFLLLVKMLLSTYNILQTHLENGFARYDTIIH